MSLKRYIIGILVFLSGFGIGFLIHYWDLDPVIQGLIGIATTLGLSGLGLLLVSESLGIIKEHYKRVRETRTANNKLIVADLQGWLNISSALMADLYYRDGSIEIDRDSGEPRDPDVKYYEETKKHLEAYNALSLWEKAKSYSQDLKKQGMDSLDQFHKKIEDIVSDLKYIRSDGVLQKPYYNIYRIREALYVEIGCRIKGQRQYSPFDVSKIGQYYVLKWGTTEIALGGKIKLRRLKKQMIKLIDDTEMQKTISTYEEIKNKLIQNDALNQFKKKLNEIIKDFNANIPLKGKCRIC